MPDPIIEKHDKLAVSVAFDRCGAFLRIKVDSFGNLNPNGIKQAISNAIDEYYRTGKAVK